MASIASINSYYGHGSSNECWHVRIHLVYFQPKYVNFGMVSLNTNLSTDDFLSKMPAPATQSCGCHTKAFNILVNEASG